jgi:hypothetical protein
MIHGKMCVSFKMFSDSLTMLILAEFRLIRDLLTKQHSSKCGNTILKIGL